MAKTSEIIRNTSIHVTISSIRLFAFIGAEVKTRRPSNSNWGSDFGEVMLGGDNSDSSTNFPNVIWLTSSTGIGQKLLPTTKTCRRVRAVIGEKSGSEKSGVSRAACEVTVKEE